MAAPSERCCICGSAKEVLFCGLCGHNFCGWHRGFWGVWQRGLEAVKQFMREEPPVYCDGHEVGETASARELTL